CICFSETLQLARHPCTLTLFIDGIICFQPDVCHTLLCKMTQLSKRLSPFFTPEYITDRLIDEYPAPACKHTFRIFNENTWGTDFTSISGNTFHQWVDVSIHRPDGTHLFFNRTFFRYM